MSNKHDMVDVNIDPTETEKKGADASNIDAVIDVVNNADPIGNNTTDLEHEPIAIPKMSKIMDNKYTRNKRRRTTAKIMLGIMCAIAVYGINVLFAIAMMTTAFYNIGGIATGIISAIVTSIVSGGGIVVYNYIARMIN